MSSIISIEKEESEGLPKAAKDCDIEGVDLLGYFCIDGEVK